MPAGRSFAAGKTPCSPPVGRLPSQLSLAEKLRASTAARFVFCVSTNFGVRPLFSFVSVLAITLVLFFVVAVSARAMLGR